MWYNNIFKSKIKNIEEIRLPKRGICTSEIFISTFNSSLVIEDCLKSLIPQLNNEIRLIIIDDCSSDKTVKLISEIIKNQKKYITFIKNKENLGLSINLYRLLESSQAIFGFRMDSDDIAFQNRFNYQLKYIKNNPEIDILGSQVEIVWL